MCIPSFPDTCVVGAGIAFGRGLSDLVNVSETALGSDLHSCNTIVHNLQHQRMGV